MARSNTRQTLYLGIKGSVVALDRTSGIEIWRTKLKSSGFTNVVLDGDRVLATVQGQIFSLDAGSGAAIWTNPLRGLGYGLCTIAGGASASLPAMAQQIQDEAAAAAAASAT